MSFPDETMLPVEAPTAVAAETIADGEERARDATRPSRWRRLRLVVGGAALLIFGFWLGARLGPFTALGSGDGLSQGTWLPAPAPAQAYIGGAVRRPGLYRLAPHERVAGLLRQAGGSTGSADLSRLSLAASVHDGESITVPLRRPGCAPGHNS